MSNNLTDLMTQKAITDVGDIGDPTKAMAATGGLLAHLKKQLPPEEFEKIMKVAGMQANILIKKFDGMDATEAWKKADIDPAKMKDWVHECTTMIRQATELDVSKQLASVA